MIDLFMCWLVDIFTLAFLGLRASGLLITNICDTNLAFLHCVLNVSVNQHSQCNLVESTRSLWLLAVAVALWCGLYICAY